MKKLVYIGSSIISFLYGFFSLLLFDMVNLKFEWDQTSNFRLPTQKGIFRGIGITIVCILLMLFLSRTFKVKLENETKKFIMVNGIVLLVALFIFWFVGAVFFIDTDTGP